MSQGHSRVASRLARLERARAARSNDVAVVLRYCDSDPDEIDRQVAAAASWSNVVVVVNLLVPRPGPLPPA